VPGPFHQWLYFHDADYLQEVVNGARTAAYLQNVGIDGIEICSVLDMAGCESYRYIPAEEDSEGNPLPEWYNCDTFGVNLEFDTPATDPAPWYNADYAHSAEALGFYIEEWTGLDSGHISRSSTQRGAAPGGVTFGPTSASGRVQKFNVLLLARTEQGMAYLFDWLDMVLTGSCKTCATDSLLFHRFCPDLDNSGWEWEGMAEQRHVALTEGLRWEADIEGRGQCFIRRASFTLTAGDPCIYGLGRITSNTEYFEPDYADCWADSYIDPDRLPCRPSCSEVINDCVYREVIDFGWNRGAAIVGPVIRLDNDFDTPSLPVRVVVRDAGQLTGNPTAARTCGLPILGEIYLKPLPAYSRLVWDVPGRRILYRDVTTGDDVESYAYIDANDPPIPRWFSVACPAELLISVAPADFCMEVDGAELIWPRGGYTFTDPHYPTVDVSVNERWSCP
jgi:hypothetical protein